jgi:shikimate kinase
MCGVFLVGFMGAGKSSVGRILATRLGRPFYDLDERLSRGFQLTIAEFFSQHGEKAFREAERRELADLASLGGIVVATGGGAFCSDGNRALIEASGGLSVLLDLPWRVLAARLDGDNVRRPLYDNAEQARQLFERRLPSYRKASVIVPLDGDESASEAADKVAAALQETPCVT